MIFLYYAFIFVNFYWGESTKIPLNFTQDLVLQEKVEEPEVFPDQNYLLFLHAAREEIECLQNYNKSSEGNCPEIKEEDLLNLTATIRHQMKHEQIKFTLQFSKLLTPPEIFCEDTSIPINQSHLDQSKNKNFLNNPKITNEFHTVIIKWNMIIATNGTQGKIPIIYILEGMRLNSEKPKWITITKTTKNYYSLKVPYQSKTYKWRVTAVGTDKLIGQATSSELTTLDGFIKPGLPKKIFISKQIIRNDSLDILIEWVPAEDKPCYYKIITSRFDEEKPSVSLRLSAVNLEHGYSVWLYNLSFGEVYDISITTRRGTWDGYQSILKSTKFQMISCLDAHNHSFVKCEPPPPQNIRQGKVLFNHSESQITQLQLCWTPPEYTSINNSISKYTLFIGNPYNTSVMGSDSVLYQSKFAMSLYTKSIMQINVPGNTTEYMLTNFKLNYSYSIAIIASSIKGNSVPVYFVISTYVGNTVLEDFAENSTSLNFHYKSVTFCGLVLISMVFIIALLFCSRKGNEITLWNFLFSVRKALVKKSVCAEDEEDNTYSRFPMVFLNDQLNNCQVDVIANCEISLENLVFEEILGQGAFGMVKKAKLIKPNKMSQCKDDHDDVDVVAVKMLKVSATSEDQSQLINELITMQNIERHDQIVRLFGACMKEQSLLCLVLEYCPGGDLLTYLRKVRQKYYPDLGLCSSFGRRYRHKASSTHVLADESSSAFSSIKYADFQAFTQSQKTITPCKFNGMSTTQSRNEFSTSSSEAQIPGSSFAYHTYQNQNEKLIQENEEKRNGCLRPTEKDILSYARQISMGMEYLERNKIVHRDLATRNILLLGNYKKIKISDFGLSRDIYTWSVYNQKSDARLPLRWMSVESILTSVFTTKSDVWSFGILLWELITLGGMPYPGLTNTELFELLKVGYRMDRPDNCSEEFYALMTKCWKQSPCSRPNFSEIQHFVESMMGNDDFTLYFSFSPGYSSTSESY